MMVVDLLIEKALSVLLEELKDIKDKNVMFKSILVKLNHKVKQLQPLIREIQNLNSELDLPESETSDFAVEMEDGAKVVRKCLQVRWYNICKKSDYTEELLQLDENLQTRIHILLVQSARDMKKALILLQREHAGVNRGGSNQAVSLLPCLEPEDTILPCTRKTMDCEYRFEEQDMASGLSSSSVIKACLDQIDTV